jgi:hypothetical protein
MNALIEVALNSRLGQPAGIDESTIESDGRKAKRTMRDLIDAGFVKEAKSDAYKNANGSYIVKVEAVLAGVVPVKPMLTVNDYHRTSVIEGRAPVGVDFNKLMQGERLWMLTYAHEYRWFWVAHNNIGDKEIDWQPGSGAPDQHWRMQLCVSDQALRDDLGAAQRAVKIAALMKQNVGWSLEKIVKIDEATVKTFMSLGSLGAFHDGDAFSGDPATWAETAKRYAERAEAKLKAAQAQVDATHVVAAVLAAYGAKANPKVGWTKLAADLLVKVEAKIDGVETDNDKEVK